MAKIVTPLTDTKIKRAKAKDKIYKLFDGNGLYLEVKPNGKKTWRVKYRLNGKEKTYTIGEYPIVTLANARAIAMGIKEKVLQGIDPVQERQKKEKENKTFAIIAEEFLKKKEIETSKTNFIKNKRRVEIYILPFLGKIKIKKITKGDIIKVIKKVKDIQTPTTKQTDKTETARRVFSLIRQIYKFALHNDYVEIDPTAAIDISAVLPKREVKNFAAILKEDEFKAMYKDFFGEYKGFNPVLNALKFLALTALHPGNVRNLAWELVDLNKKIIIYPASAMKGMEQFRLPLTDTLIKILEEQAFMKGKKEGFVFFGIRGKQLRVHLKTTFYHIKLIQI
jgi:integrase